MNAAVLARAVQNEAVAIVRPSAWTVLAGLGGLAAASFAWTGHGGIGAGVLGPAHLLADIIHLLAATAWIGALPVLALLALDHRDPASAASALRDFSRLEPALDRAIARGEPPPRALITSLVLETLLGATVLGLVAWMGTVLPAAHA